ncbi:type VII secretion target [Actinophytocola xanthii]|uniref:Uncharacterized protein n=1 Tax=Actinophytocola xanthii TaxID=1912961 RepID=A0A1Q8BU65_9PSEU|nr:type VII secretion target [Actinophytocola xanthii]OLF05664.1 hypothetical protein BU204_36940 [Actinophytocola xanthii]
MSDGFDVSVEELRRHAAAVGDLAGQVSSAGAATPPPVGGDAFSTIGAFFTQALVSAGEQLREALETGTRSVADVQTGLSAVADVYERVDDTHAQLLRIVDEGGGASPEPRTDATRSAAPADPATGAVQQAGVVPVGLTGPVQAPPGQRAKAIAVLQRISKENPVSVATVALPEVRWLYSWAKDNLSAKIGDHYERDIPHLLSRPPTDANLREVVETETRFWHSTEGNWAGRMLSADDRFDRLVNSRTEWLNAMPPAERDRIARELGVQLGR